MSAIWYVRRRDQIKGPFKPSIIARFIATDRIQDSDELSLDRKDWQSARAARPTFAAELAKLNDIPAPVGGEVVDGRLSVAGAELDVAGASGDTAPLGIRGNTPPLAACEAPNRSDTVPAAESRARNVEAAPAHGLVARPRVRPHRSTRITPETKGMRIKQVASLVSVMAVIAVAGVAFLPAEELNPPDCLAVAAPTVNWSNCRFEGLELKRAELAGASLRSIHLTNAQLFGAMLEGADLAFAELTGANLSYADLTSVNAVGADLRRADLAYANLRGADLSHADLSGANLGGTDLTNAKFDNAIWLDKRVCHEGSTGGCRLPMRAPRQGNDG